MRRRRPGTVSALVYLVALTLTGGWFVAQGVAELVAPAPRHAVQQVRLSTPEEERQWREQQLRDLLKACAQAAQDAGESVSDC